MHPNYEVGKFQDNIGISKLKSSVKITPICLVANFQSNPGSSFVYGWKGRGVHPLVGGVNLLPARLENCGGHYNDDLQNGCYFCFAGRENDLCDGNFYPDLGSFSTLIKSLQFQFPSTPAA